MASTASLHWCSAWCLSPTPARSNLLDKARQIPSDFSGSAIAPGVVSSRLVGIGTSARLNSSILFLMAKQNLLTRVSVDPEICAGRPFIRGTRIYIAVILDALNQGLTAEGIVEHYPVLELDDIRAAVAFATHLAEENGGLALVGRQYLNKVLHPL